MTSRLQVSLAEDEIDEIRRLAKAQQLSVSEWIRRALRKARFDESSTHTAGKLSLIRRAAKHNFPTADIQQMLAEIAGAGRLTSAR